MELENKVVYITGGSSGIGFSIAKYCLEIGASVIITGRNQERLEIAKDNLLKVSKNILALQADASNENEIKKSVDQALNKFKRIDCLVNNAPSIHTGLIEDLEFDQWRTNFKANLDGAFLLSRNVIPIMRKNNYGSIVNISSVVGLQGTKYMGAYGAAKAGLINFTKTLAIECAPLIRVNCIIPGAVMTPATKKAIPDQDMLEQTTNSIPLKRIAMPHEIAIPTVFLLSEHASFITGTTLIVDGGKTADLNAGN